MVKVNPKTKNQCRRSNGSAGSTDGPVVATKHIISLVSQLTIIISHLTAPPPQNTCDPNFTLLESLILGDEWVIDYI